MAMSTTATAASVVPSAASGGERVMKEYFELGQLYKHSNCYDVAIQVLCEPNEDSGKLDLTVTWWNVCSKPNFDMQIIENIQIKKEDVYKWRKLDR